MKQLLLLLMVAFATNLQAKNYYVSATGNDASDGLTTATPWKSIAKVNSFTFAANDYILFKRGDTFYGGIIVSRSNLFFDAYGTGNKPIISGLLQVTGWINLGGNIWEAPVTNVKNGVNLVLRDGVIQQVGRYPNSDAPNKGYLFYTSANSLSVTGPAISSGINWTGSQIVIRINRWEFRKATVTSHAGGVVSFSSIGTTPRNGFSYFFQRDSRTLDQDGEWWHDPVNNKLRVYVSNNNPSNYNFQITTVDSLFTNVYSTISVKNISFIGGGRYGIFDRGGNGTIIKDCDVNYSAVDGINSSSSSNVLVDKCTTKNSLSSGIRVSTPFTGVKNLSITNCIVDSTALIAGMEVTDGISTNSSALLCKGGDNVTIMYNRVTNSGWVGIEWQGNNVNIKYNFVDSYCSVRDDGGGIYTVETGKNYLIPVRTNRNIISNIVLNGIGANSGSDEANGTSARGLYCDLGTRDVVMDSNTVANNIGTAFHGNNNRNITIKNSVFFNNIGNFSICRFDSAALIRNIVIKKNILYPYRLIYRNLGINNPNLITKQADILAMGIIDSNYYSLRSGRDTSLHAVTTNIDRSNYTETGDNFSYLTGTIGIETHSINVANTGTLEYNATNSPKIVSFLGFSKKDVFGNVYNNSVTIPAWSSKVLIANGVVPTSNIPPKANAGTNQSIILPINTITLLGAGTDTDGTISNYTWKKLSGPTSGNILTPNASTTAVNNLVQGVYQFELTVTDNNGAIGKDSIEVTVNAMANQAPMANAGINQTITLPTNTTTLSGIGTDKDGTISDYEWIKISGPTSGNIVTPNIATTLVNNLVQGIYTFEFTVTDNNGSMAKDTLQVDVKPFANQAPIANAGTYKTITLPTNTTNLDGTGTDTDGTIISYAWVKISGPAAGTIATPNAATTAVNNLVQGIFIYELTVTDNNGANAKDTVQVTVIAAANKAPVANAGSDKSITLPVNTTSLNGAGTDTDGTISSYAWVKISGPASGTIATPNAATTAVNNLVQGIFKYELTVTDNNGAKAKDTVQLTVNTAGNQAPVANAGLDKSITLPVNTTSLIGSGTDADGTVSSYAWVKISGPASGTITTPNAATTAVNNLVQGIFKYELTVTDNDGAFAKDTIQVNVISAINQAPVANAGADKTITLPVNSTSLIGFGTDIDGTISSYTWVKISGPASGTIASPNAAATTVNNLIQGIYQYQITVTDNSGANGMDTVQVTVNVASNQAPTANAGNKKSIKLPTNAATLSGSGTDVDGTIISYTWTKVSGPLLGSIATGNQAITEVTNLVQGIYQFELAVTDNNGAIGRDTAQVTVNAATNQAPVAKVGSSKKITETSNSITLSGSGEDADGTISSYQWAKVSGPVSGTIVTAHEAITLVHNLVSGIYEFELTVTDNNGAIGKDTLQVTVSVSINQVPVANAGIDKTITLPGNTTSLNGIGSDSDGTISSYAWLKISGPEQGNIASANKANTEINQLIQGIYQYELTVTDNKGALGKDTVQVTVNAVPNQAPLANAGVDKTITLPVNSISLIGAGTDTDGTISSYAWIKISGPEPGTIATANNANTAINNLVQGLYQFELTVKDNNGATGKDTIKVFVNAPINEQPLANAGADKTITLPVNSISLTGIGTDSDGTISSYTWVKISGPAQGNIATVNAASTEINNLVVGIYQFELTVTDNNGAIGKDTVQVTVNAAPNLAPKANSGADQIIELPLNTISLNGGGTDLDGSISSYTWIKITGPAAGEIESKHTSTTAVNNLIQGVYQFELTVTDNNGAIGKDTVQVTVNAAAIINKIPVINAGDDINIVLPTNSISLKGTATDPDGTIVSYKWEVISGPSGHLFTTPNLSETKIENLFQGVYLIQCTALDNSGAEARDSLSITVSSPRLSNINSNSNSTNKFNVYPNPVKDIANININTINKNTKLSIVVMNVSGNLVAGKEFVTTDHNTIYQLDMSNLANGLYLITLRFDDGQILSTRVIKNGSN